jgi:glycosyltransferase involved in cell wall biosynthesis
MMHLFINSLAASAGGGLTYIRNVIPQFALRTDLRVTAALSPGLRSEFGSFSNIEFPLLEIPARTRFWYEQRALPGIIRSSGASVLLSAGNFALRKSPVPQILLSRNSLYISRDFYRDLRSRHEFRMWLDTHVRAFFAKRSIYWADATVAPSQAFAKDLEEWTGEPVAAIHHGFDREEFSRDCHPLPQLKAQIDSLDGCLKILFVSHYNYYRNFETLIRALPVLRNRLEGRSVRLLLTCQLATGVNPGIYRPGAAARLVKELDVSDMVVELGAIPYQQLHQLYARADIYVTPAYTETFAHPVVEAMASGVPVVASDLPVHREICGEAAIYFERFCPEGLADCVFQIANGMEIRKKMVAAGLTRAGNFSWKVHVEQIMELSRMLMDSGASSLKLFASNQSKIASTGEGRR